MQRSAAIEHTPAIPPDTLHGVVSDLFARAVALHQEGRLADAEAIYRRLIVVAPNHAETWSNLALALIARGACEEAAISAQRALMIVPDYADAQINLVVALEGEGRVAETVPAYRAALALRPDRSALYAGLGSAYERLGDWAEAAAVRRSAAHLFPDDAMVHFDLGRSLAALGRAEEAVSAYSRALVINPDMIEALSNLGTTLVFLARYVEAGDVSRRAVAFCSDNAEINNNHAVVVHQQGLTAEAVEFYERALALQPDYPQAWANLAVAYQQLFRFDDAVEALEKAVALKPDYDSAVVELVKLRRHICDWSQYENDSQILTGLIGRETDAIFMLLLMAFPSSLEQQLASACQHMTRLNQNSVHFAAPARATVSRRLRIGYLSADYRDHPVGRLIPEMLTQHSHAGFEIFGYALGLDDTCRIRRRVSRACDHFIDLHGLSNREAASRIYDDGIDILVDLTGPTTGARLEILNFRPAPVQISFLGWPGTTGLDCIDYVIGDALLTPADHQDFYSERIVQLPYSYQPSDPYRGTILPALTRAECGLPEGDFVFCSFNNTIKLTPEVFDVWLRLLSKVDRSVLWLYSKTPRTMENLKAWAEKRGISPQRIIFAPVAGMDLYLSRLRLADLFLDSYPYNAGATCNDALWMGLPVLTCAGDSYVSRMAASLLSAVGLPELITTSLGDYELLAYRLASEPLMLADLKRRLMANRDATPLFDMPRFTAALEVAFMHMHSLSQQGRPPEGFSVGDTWM